MSKLTEHPEGSAKELWKISFPLMISSLATMSMLFVDRLFLAHYSLGALNASVNASNLAWVFSGGLGMLTAMSEVFVARYNGAGLNSKIGPAVWQMLWIALFSFALFLPLAFQLGPRFFSAHSFCRLEQDYFLIAMLFGPAYPLLTALSGFFVGRGQTRILIILAFLGNLLNVLLDRLFIFGFPGWVPEMGIKGAAIATSIGSLFQVAVLFCLFLKKNQREKFQTAKPALNLQLLKLCLKIGLPQGLFYSVEVLGWSFFFFLMTDLGEGYITISAVCQSLILLFSFFLDGLSRGVTAIAGNFLGAKKIDRIAFLLKSGLKLQLAFSLFTAFFFIFQPRWLLEPLFALEAFGGRLNFDLTFRFCLFCTSLYLFFEGLRWVLAGFLTAAGDTLFLMLSGAFSVWIFFLLPVYLSIVLKAQKIELAWLLAAAYAALLCLVYFLRFKKGKWKALDLLDRKKAYSEIEQNQELP
ncbi:MAG: MATE family efflux transporter [Parachlamydiales bacterium]|jgi:MATE family multidrug resistance protein